jgi:hypothetical protein
MTDTLKDMHPGMFICLPVSKPDRGNIACREPRSVGLCRGEERDICKERALRKVMNNNEQLSIPMRLGDRN